MKHPPPGCKTGERWPHFYKYTTLYVCLMLTIVVALLIKGAS